MKLRREYIGDTLKVLSSSNTSLEGREGRIVDETQHTFRVDTPDARITILKQPCVFRIGNDTIKGRNIKTKPHQRLNL